MVVIFALLTFFSTFGGGLLGIKYKDKLHLILGLTAGVLLGVVAFDLLPEIFELISETGVDVTFPMLALVIGFLAFHILEKLVLIHHSHEEHYDAHHHKHVGTLSALALIGHSFLDGVGIGLGFQVSEAAGILVAIAVLSHDFSDGLNTVSLMLAHKHPDKNALKMLFLDAIAPLLGALSTLVIAIPSSYLVLYLGFFAGFLLYIGSADILPEAHSHHSSRWTILMTILGVGFIFAITRVL